MKKVSSEDFLKDFSSATVEKNGFVVNLGKKLMAAMILVASVASPVMANNLDLENSGIKEISKINVEQVIEGEKNGVYKHPLYEDKIIVLDFESNEDSDQKIKRDFEDLGISSTGYSFQKFLSEVVYGDDNNNNKGSHHIGEPLNIGVDANYIYMNNKHNERELGAFMQETNSVNIEGMNINTSESNADFFKENKTEINKYLSVYAFYHEVGHSIEEQEPEILAELAGAFDSELAYLRENSSNVVGLVMTLQLMNENNESENLVNDFLTVITGSRDTALTNLHSINEEDCHYDIPTSNFIINQYIEDKDTILSISNNDIAKYSMIVAENAIDHNYYNDLKVSFGKMDYEVEKLEKYMLETVKWKEEDLKSFERSVVSYQDMLTSNTDRELPVSYTYMAKYADKFAAEWLTDSERKEFAQEVVMEHYVGAEEKDFSILDIEVQKKISISHSSKFIDGKTKIPSFDQLDQKILSNLEKELGIKMEDNDLKNKNKLSNI
jgi:hypothetical protein